MNLRDLGLAPVVRWDCWNGTSYTCLPCYEKSLTATATTCLTSTVTVYEVPAGTHCENCNINLGGRRAHHVDDQELADAGFSS